MKSKKRNISNTKLVCFFFTDIEKHLYNEEANDQFRFKNL